MLEREVATTAETPVVAAAARVCARFTQQLMPLIGEAGVAAICDRAVHLAQQQIPGLTPVRRPLEGDAPFALLLLSLEQLEPAAGTEAAVAVLATASELLASFIGESLTTSLLREAWPDDFAGGTTEESTT